MRRLKPWIILIILPVLLSGCRQNKPISLKLVQWMHVDGATIHGENNRYFYVPENMDKLLMAMRQTGQTRNPIRDPNQVNSPEFCITTVYADGNREHLYVKGDRYIRQEDGPWRQVDPDKLAPLHYLLHFQSGDAVS